MSRTVFVGLFLSMLVLLASLTGCNPQVSRTFMPDGTAGYKVECTGPLMNMGDCASRAGQLCGERGYDIISSAPGAYNKYIFIKCKGEDPLGLENGSSPIEEQNQKE